MSTIDDSVLGLPRTPTFQQRSARILFRELEGRPSRILEAGCGPCPVTAVLARVDGFETHCCDIAEPQALPEGAIFRQLDLTRPLPYEDGFFDGIACTEVIEHLKSPFVTLDEFARILRPGGVLVFSIPNFWNVRRRVRYLLTGNLNKTSFFRPEGRRAFRANSCPHINTMSLPTYEFGLASMGIELVGMHVGAVRRSRWMFWPLAVGIQFLNLYRRGDQRRKFMLDHTNRRQVLMGGEHIILVGRHVGYDNVAYDLLTVKNM